MIAFVRTLVPCMDFRAKFTQGKNLLVPLYQYVGSDSRLAWKFSIRAKAAEKRELAPQVRISRQGAAEDGLVVVPHVATGGNQTVVITALNNTDVYTFVVFSRIGDYVEGVGRCVKRLLVLCGSFRAGMYVCVRVCVGIMSLVGRTRLTEYAFQQARALAHAHQGACFRTRKHRPVGHPTGAHGGTDYS
jgi:hypothetical protein